MKLRPILFTFLSLFFSNINTTAQGWFESYDFSAPSHYVGGVVQTPDGGYAVTGYFGNGTGPMDIRVVKTDDRGKLQWTKVIGGPTTSEYSYGLLMLPDQTLLVSAGNIGPPAFYKLDLAGNLLAEGGESGSAILEDVDHLSSGRYVKSGISFASNPDGTSTQQAAVMIYDSVFNFVGAHEWNNIPVSDDEAVMSLVELDDGSLMDLRLSKQNAPNGAVDSAFVDRLDADGNLLWTLYQETYESYPFGGNIVKTSDGNVVTGYLRTNTGFRLRKRTPEGTLLWTKTVPINGAEGVQGFINTSDDGFVIIGALNGDIQLTRLDPSGNVLWEKTLDMPSLGAFRLEIKETSDHGFIISGSKRFQGSAPFQFFLMRTNSSGDFKLNKLQGHLKKDVDGDCIPGATEPPLENWIVEAQGQYDTFYGKTDSAGFYSIPLYDGTYNVRFRYPGLVFFDVCTDETPVVITGTATTVVLDMAAVPLFDCPLMDVDISSGILRPCFESRVSAHYCNYGTMTATGAGLVVKLDSFMLPVWADAPYSVVDNSLHFLLGDVAPQQCGDILIGVMLDCGVVPGTEHCVSAKVQPGLYCGQGPLPDGISFEDEHCRPSTASYDPNDKTVSPEGTGAGHLVQNDTTFSYLIRFQNTGTDTAFQVVLIDSLSADLDPGTIRAGAGSHPYEWEVYGQGVLRFTFRDIMLPDSNVNEVASHGFVAFEIRPRPSLLPGTVIDNKAGIIFDYNAPVVTNGVFNTIAKPVHYGTQMASVCTGGLFNGTLVSADTMLSDTVQMTWYDSVTVFHIQALGQSFETLQATICEGEEWTFNGQVLTDAGEYQAVYVAANGCDSLVTLALGVVVGQSSEVSAQMCNGESYPFGTQSLKQAGVYQAVFQAFNGCDSLVTLTLDVLPEVVSDVSAVVCADAPYMFDGQTLSQTGQYQAIFQGMNGCDSIVNLALEVLSAIGSDYSAQICAGETYLFNGQPLGQPGQYGAVVTAMNGCDSNIVLNLEVWPSAGSDLNAQVCAGETYFFNGQILDQTGQYEAILTVANGCDSTVALYLDVLPAIETNVAVSLCAGAVYLFNGQELSQGGTYTAVFEAVNGCDSVVSLDLDIMPILSSYDTVQICHGDTFLFNGQSLAVGGAYEALATASDGCDSLSHLWLEVLPEITSNISAQVCEGETYWFAGQELFQSGLYQGFFITASGCDSTVSLTLDVTEVLENQLTATICEGDVYGFHGQLLTLPGVYTALFENGGGCDSLITLQLDVKPHTMSQISASICGDSTYHFGGMQLMETGIYEAVFPAANGCDSTSVLELTVLPTFESIVSLEMQSGASYNGIPVFSDTTIVEHWTAQNGCDSTATVSIGIVTSTGEIGVSDIQLYSSPNPFSDELFIHFQLPNPTVITIGSTDLMGREVVQILDSKAFLEGHHQLLVHTAGWVSGMYLLHFKTEEGVRVIKVVKG